MKGKTTTELDLIFIRLWENFKLVSWIFVCIQYVAYHSKCVHHYTCTKYVYCIRYLVILNNMMHLSPSMPWIGKAVNSTTVRWALVQIPLDKNGQEEIAAFCVLCVCCKCCCVPKTMNLNPRHHHGHQQVQVESKHFREIIVAYCMTLVYMWSVHVDTILSGNITGNYVFQ